MGQSKKKRRSKNTKSGNAEARRGYQRVGIALVVVIILFGAAIVFSPTDQSGTPENFVPQVLGAPRVAVAQDEVDFGDIKLDRTVEAVFRVRNIGDQVLRILDQEPSVELVEGC
ncbi:MAG: DUF1573 domain-containing protein [Anaerolineae bacterium]|nr:DUF1573 domain-containing protein [Anaerolineae bacterium]